MAANWPLSFLRVYGTRLHPIKTQKKKTWQCPTILTLRLVITHIWCWNWVINTNFFFSCRFAAALRGDEGSADRSRVPVAKSQVHQPEIRHGWNVRELWGRRWLAAGGWERSFYREPGYRESHWLCCSSYAESWICGTHAHNVIKRIVTQAGHPKPRVFCQRRPNVRD